MKLGRIVGTVVSTRKDASLESRKLLSAGNEAAVMAIVDRLDIEGRSTRRA